jgi:hypothetical protein
LLAKISQLRANLDYEEDRIKLRIALTVSAEFENGKLELPTDESPAV